MITSHCPQRFFNERCGLFGASPTGERSIIRPMPYQRAPVAVLLTVCALLIALAVGQSRSNAVPKVESHDSCAGSHEGRSASAEVLIDNVTFSGFLRRHLLRVSVQSR
jgi:hypothetical protein